MYGLSDQSNGMPWTRFSAERQGYSRYSTRIPVAKVTEHVFATPVEVEPGILRVTLPLPSGPRHVHCFLIRGADGWTLVDTGLGLLEPSWEEILARVDGPVVRIFITHMHPDHVGGAEAAVRATGAPVFQGRLDYAQCERVWGSDDWPERIAEWFVVHGVPSAVAEELIESGHVFADFVRFAWNPTLVEPGDHVDGWRVHATPGHADGHLSLYRDGVLVAGDTLLAPITPAIGLYPESRPDPLGDYVDTLRLLAALILLNAFFVAAEYGLVTARRTRIIELQHQGNRRARDVLRITGDPPRFIAAMQLGVTLTSLAIGALGEHVLTQQFDPWVATALAIALSYLILTFFHVVIGELVPKGVALSHSEGTALWVSAPVRAFFTVAEPLIWVLQRSTEVVLRIFGVDPPGAERDVLSEAELRMLVSRSTREGEIEVGEQQMIDKVFVFGDKDAADVMVAKPDVTAISVDMPAEKAIETVLDHPYTRYPVFRGTLDDIVGVLHVRDLFSAIHERGEENLQ